jgi:hypothetical protein
MLHSIMSKADHLAWAKRRAFEHVDDGDMRQAMISFHSDLSKHVDTRGEASHSFVALLLLQNGTAEELRDWIEHVCARLNREPSDG